MSILLLENYIKTILKENKEVIEKIRQEKSEDVKEEEIENKEILEELIKSDLKAQGLSDKEINNAIKVLHDVESFEKLNI